MTGILLCTCSNTCQADSTCDHLPSFQVRLDAPADARRPRIQRSTEACGAHLGTMVVAMTAWAREQDLTVADLTILTIAPPSNDSDPSPRPHRGCAQTSGFIFSIIHLGEQDFRG